VGVDSEDEHRRTSVAADRLAWTLTPQPHA